MKRSKLYITLLIVLLSYIQVLSEKTNNYGQFKLEITKLDSCKGPKKKNCSIYTANVVGKTHLNFDFVITENMSPTQGRVITSSNNNELLRLQIKKPCENLFIMPLFRILFNITNNCVIKKGHYAFTIDFEDILRKYYGGMHLYGFWSFKSHFNSDQCNLSCAYIEVNITGPN